MWEHIATNITDRSKSVSNTDRYGCAFPIPVRSIRFPTGMQTLSLTGSKPSKRSAHGESCSRRAVHRVCWSRTWRSKEMVSFNESMAIHDDPLQHTFAFEIGILAGVSAPLLQRRQSAAVRFFAPRNSGTIAGSWRILDKLSCSKTGRILSKDVLQIG